MADESPQLPSPADGPRVEPTPGMPSSPVPPGAIQAEPPPMPPIVLDPKRQQMAPLSTLPKMPNKDAEFKDTFRELLETVVFVVVLVLMLKTFLAEAFVIPTGSMADTLLGYHYKVTCDQCGYRNLVNASSEAEPQRGEVELVVSCQCQNCGAVNIIRHNNMPQVRREQP